MTNKVRSKWVFKKHNTSFRDLYEALGTLCPDNRYEQYSVRNKIIVLYRVVKKESAYFDFEVFSKYCKNVNKIIAKNLSSKFDLLQDYLLNTLPAPAHGLKPGHKEIYLKSGSPEGDIQLKSFLCSSFASVEVGSVAGLYCKSSFIGNIYLQFIMASHTMLEVNVVCASHSVVGKKRRLKVA